MPEDVNNAAETSAVATFTQFDSWDNDGNPVVTKKLEPKTEETAASAAPAKGESEGKPKSAAESEAAPKQEKKPGDKLSAGEELGKLRRELREAREELERERSRIKPEPKPEQPKEPQYTRPKPKSDDKDKDGKPKYNTYEEFVEELADWKAEQRMVAQQREQQAAQLQQSVGQKLEEARIRYEDYDSKAKPVLQELLKPEIPREVFGVIEQSPVLPDLLYTIGGNETSKTDFLTSCRENPSKALRVALLMEQEIIRELAKSKPEKKEDPAPPKPRAPKPPSEVGGRGATGEDALVSAAKANDFRAFEAEQRRRALSR